MISARLLIREGVHQVKEPNAAGGPEIEQDRLPTAGLAACTVLISTVEIRTANLSDKRRANAQIL